MRIYLFFALVIVAATSNNIALAADSLRTPLTPLPIVTGQPHASLPAITPAELENALHQRGLRDLATTFPRQGHANLRSLMQLASISSFQAPLKDLLRSAKNYLTAEAVMVKKIATNNALSPQEREKDLRLLVGCHNNFVGATANLLTLITATCDKPTAHNLVLRSESTSLLLVPLIQGQEIQSIAVRFARYSNSNEFRDLVHSLLAKAESLKAADIEALEILQLKISAIPQHVCGMAVLWAILEFLEVQAPQSQIETMCSTSLNQCMRL